MTSKPDSQLSYTECVLLRKVAQICDDVGYSAITQDSCNILVDIYQKTIFHLGRHCKEAANRNRRYESTLTDLSQAFANVGVSLTELEEHIEKVKLPFPVKIEEPEAQESRLQRNIIEEDGLEDEKKDDDNLSENGLDEDEKPAVTTLKDTYLEIISQFPPVEVGASSKAKKPKKKKTETPIEPTIPSPPYVPRLEIKTEPSTSSRTPVPIFASTSTIDDDAASIAVAEAARSVAAKATAAKAAAARAAAARAAAARAAKATAARAAAAKAAATEAAVARAARATAARAAAAEAAAAEAAAAVRASAARTTAEMAASSLGCKVEDLCPDCYLPDDGTLMIQCDGPGCGKWYHGKCAGLLEEPKDDESWFCKPCVERNEKPVVASVKETYLGIISQLPPIEVKTSSKVKKTKRPKKTKTMIEPAVPSPTYMPRLEIKTEPSTSSGTPVPVFASTSTIDDAASIAAAEAARAAAARATAEAAAAALGCKVEDLCPECYLPDDGTLMIQCDDPCCAKWFHGKCAGLLDEPKEDESWFCKACVEKQQSAFKRRRAQRKPTTADTRA